ncbi:hypothetical protein C3L33_19901, partial [Rhododendron williamsianum]
MKLKEDVKKMLKEVVDPLDGLEMIDDLQRLGVFYHFEDEIKRVLESIYNNNKHDKWNEDDLHATSLKFRLLRQYEVFENFMDKTGHFNACLCKDIRGMLYLYEASFLSFRGESTLEEARDFATKNLEQDMKRKDIDQDLASLVSHALELPLHWRMPRLEARWFIDLCERRPNMNPVLLQLAKLDFNMVQATHQEDLKHMSRWWSKIGLAKKLGFARDRLMENFLWTIGINFKPQFSNLRRNITIVNALITIIDDVYDVYGTLNHELEIFTNAIERWDINAMEQLPYYMKICYLALLNSINEMGYETLKEQGIHIIPHLQKSDEIKRGDTPKSIQFYMHETGASEEDAQEHIKYLIRETWKKMNEDRFEDSAFSQTLVEIAMNLARMSQCMYQYGDGHAAQGWDTKDRVLSLLVNSIPVEY